MPSKNTFIKLFNAPFFIPSILFALGIAIANSYTLATPIFNSYTFFICIITAISSYKKKKQWSIIFLFVATFILGGIAYLHDTQPSESILDKQLQTRIGKVISTPKYSSNSLSVDMRISGQKIKVRLIDDSLQTLHLCSPAIGDLYLLHSTIDSLRDNGTPYEFKYASYLRRHHYKGTSVCFAGQWRYLRNDPKGLFFARWREKLMKHYRKYFKDQHLAIISALTLGIREHISSNTRQLFSDSGTAHLLALSGLHLSILIGFYFFLISPLYKHNHNLYRIFTLLALLLIWTFTALAGLPISLVRSAIMLSIVTLCIALNRSPFSLNNLSIAALLILICWPTALFDAGFQLSFSAVTSLLLASPLIHNVTKKVQPSILRYIFGLLLASIVAQLGTFPLVAYHFHRIPIYGTFASLIGIPITYALLTLAIIFFIFPPISSILSLCINTLLSLLLHSLKTISLLPAAVLQWYPSALTVLILYLCAFSFYLLCKKHTRSRCLLFLFIVLLLPLSILRQKKQEYIYPQIIFYREPHTPCIHCISSAKENFLITPDSTAALRALHFTKESFWKRTNLSTPIIINKSYKHPHILLYQHLLLFGQRKIALAYKPYPKTIIEDTTTKPLHVDYLYIGRGYRQPISQLLGHFQPDSIIISSSFPSYQYLRIQKELDSLHIPYYDMHYSPTLCISAKK